MSSSAAASSSQGASSGSGADNSAPSITAFSLDPDVASATLTYAATDQTLPIHYVIVRSRQQQQLDALVPGTFGQSGNLVAMPSTTSPGPFVNDNLATGSVFFFRLEACDSAQPVHCSASSTVRAVVGLPHISVALGTPEKVWDYGDQSCNTQQDLWDLPDIQARAVKNHLGELMLIRGNAPYIYAMFGQNFSLSGQGALQTNCNDGPVLSSGNVGSTTSAPWEYDHHEWLTSTYRDPVSNRIHALVHNEYHDPRQASSPPCTLGDVTAGNPCWLNSLLYVYSDDGGHHFTKPAQKVVATPPQPWDPHMVPNGHGGYTPPLYGYMTPTNIVSANGFYYSLFMAITSPPQTSSNTGVCVMRTDNLADPSSWRAWDGNGYTLTMAPPYDAQGNVVPTNVPACTLVDPGIIGDLNGSLTYNTYLQKFLLVGAAQRNDPDTGTIVCGFYFSVSADLIHWSLPKLLKQAPLPWGACGASNGAGAQIYPSIIDHRQLQDPSDPNFEKSGVTPHVYYTLWNQGVDRDLWRQPLTICEQGKPVQGLCP